MGTYAKGTSVTPGRSREEIERILARYGAEGFMYGWDQGRAMVAFRAHGRHIRFTLPMPDRENYRYTPTRRTERKETDITKHWEQAQAEQWRALCLAVKAKLETVESGIATFEEEWAAYIVLPDGRTLGEWALPQVEEAYETGRMPSMLPALESGGA